jgi:IS5 family transposase
MKAYIGLDANSGMLQGVLGTLGHVPDVTEGSSLLHGEEAVVFTDAGYQGVKRPDTEPVVRWQVTMRPSKRKKIGEIKQFFRRGHRQNRATLGWDPCQGQAPVSRG